MVSKKVVILNSHGIHTRPATALVETASSFDSEVTLIYNGERSNSKSIMGVLVLAVEPGAEVEIETEGEDEEDALEKLVSLIEHKFYTE